MSKLKNVGFDVLYPSGCKEVHEGLRLDELKRRLGDLMKCLENMSEDYVKEYDSLLSETRMDVSDSTISPQSKYPNLQGLLLHLSSEQFVDHHDADVQLRVAVCICYIIKILCPQNPFLCYTDSESITQTVLQFLLKCIKELSRLRTKSDKLFLPVFTVLSICCDIDIFHFYTTISNGEKFLAECFHVFFDVIRRSSDWGEDTMLSKTVTDAMVNLLSSPDASVSEALVTYLLNLIVDRCSSKIQKQVVLEIFSKCFNKLEEQIQMVLQTYLIKNERVEDLSESSDNEDGNTDDDDFCSLDSYKLMLKKSDKIKPKTSTKVSEPGKNSIEPNIEYGCHHVFQMIFEMFQISESIVTPLLPTIEMKLRSSVVTDRKRACRLLGKLFSSSASNDSPNHTSLWETFLGRLSDIDMEVREICVRVARDLLKKALDCPDNCGIMSLAKEKEDLVRAFQKRSNDQEESIRYLIVVAVAQVLDQSRAVVHDEELDVISAAMFKLLLMESRDKFLSVRKEAHAAMGKLYRRMIIDSESRNGDGGEVDLTLGLRNLRRAQKARAELMLNLILRPYLSADVDDRIVVERLFNTCLVPYSADSGQRMKALLQCLTLCDDPSVLCIHEMFKTQVSVMNIVRQTIVLIGDSASSDTAISPLLSQRLREKVKKLSEYLSGKDKVDSLTKVFNQARTDKRLNELLRRFTDEGSTRTTIVKTITDIKKHLTGGPSKATADSATSAAALSKKKSFINSVKCILERGAPIIFDGESVQELLCHCVSTKEAMESGGVLGTNVVSLGRRLRLLHTMMIMSRRLVPLHETYEYLVSVMGDLGDGGGGSDDDNVEHLCLAVMAKMVHCPDEGMSPLDGDVEERPHRPHGTHTLFSDVGSTNGAVVTNTVRLIDHLTRCCVSGASEDRGSMVTVVKCHGRRKEPHDGKESDGHAVRLAKWRYDCRVAKLASRCLIGLLQSCQYEERMAAAEDPSKEVLSSLLEGIKTAVFSVLQQCRECTPYSDHQPVMLTSMAHLSLAVGHLYEAQLRSFATEVLPRLLADSDDQSVTVQSGSSKNLSLWQEDSAVSVRSQVRIQALKLLSRWVVTLKADQVSDQKCIVYVMSSLRKYIGTYGNDGYGGCVSDKEMSHLRLSAGKCWLRVAQVQSFLPIFEVKWIHRLSSLVHDPCPQVRDQFLRKLHIGLFKLKLPLEYMAMFVFVGKVKSPEYVATAKKYLHINITRRRDFLDTYPDYLSDAKKLFGVLPEYVLCFVIHMLAHDPLWPDTIVDVASDEYWLNQVKQCLWFVMEPILKMNENYSFIRKLLERIKHAQDAAEPTNARINEKLYVCADIGLGLLISKQSSYDLKEYPVELKLPRTRFISAPHAFFNPDFANILADNNKRARIKFSPTARSRQMAKNCMPALLIKSSHYSHEMDSGVTVTTFPGASGQSMDQQQGKSALPLKAKKRTAKIVFGVPEIESEVVSPHPPSAVHKVVSTKHKLSPEEMQSSSDQEDMSASQTSVTTMHGRVCKPNVRVMKDMVSPTKREMDDVEVKKKRVSSPAKRKKTKEQSILDLVEVPSSVVRIEGTVSVNIERLISDVMQKTLGNDNGRSDLSGDQDIPLGKRRRSSPIKDKGTSTKVIDQSTKMDQPASKAAKIDQPASKAAKMDQTASKAVKMDQTASKAAKMDQSASKAAKMDQTASKAAKMDQTASKAAKMDQPASKAAKMDQPASKAAKMDQPASKAAKMDQSASKAAKMDQTASKKGVESKGRAKPLTRSPVKVSDGGTVNSSHSPHKRRNHRRPASPLYRPIPPTITTNKTPRIVTDSPNMRSISGTPISKDSSKISQEKERVTRQSISVSVDAPMKPITVKQRELTRSSKAALQKMVAMTCELINSSPTKSPNKERLTRQIVSPVVERVTRTTSSSRVSPVKQRVTRTPSSPRATPDTHSSPKASTSKSPVSPPLSRVTVPQEHISRRQSILAIRQSASRSSTDKASRAPSVIVPTSTESTARSSPAKVTTPLSGRSKRLASHIATEELMKKSRRV